MRQCGHTHTHPQAQERGELTRLRDDAAYALDGLLPSAPPSTQRDSVVALLEIMATPRGRAALRWAGWRQGPEPEWGGEEGGGRGEVMKGWCVRREGLGEE